jgi:two-component system chemotaxis response regulator CheB
MSRTEPRLIVIGASAGGYVPLRAFFDRLAPSVHAPILVIQHIASSDRVETRKELVPIPGRNVREVQDKMPLEPDHVYFATPGYHTLVERPGLISLSLDDPVNFSRPSIDVAFESAALAYGPAVAGIVLSGANTDGSAGLKQISEAGGLAIVQDPNEAQFRLMPEAAIRAAGPVAVSPVAEIARLITKTFTEISRKN